MTYSLLSPNWIKLVCKVVRGPVGKTQTGPRTSWQNTSWSADQLAKHKLVRGPGSGFLDTAADSGSGGDFVDHKVARMVSRSSVLQGYSRISRSVFSGLRGEVSRQKSGTSPFGRL